MLTPSGSINSLAQAIMQDPIINSSDPMNSQRPLHERRLKPHGDQALKCPRCDSLNTKFCYFNNYSLTQPRHFCKNCKRYWTKGGALRNVPVGGGCRKNKRAKHRSVEQAPSPVPAADEALLSSIRGDGSSSSSSLQQDFSGGTSSPGLYVSNDGDGGFNLTFERAEQASRSYGISSAPISINWAAGQVPAPPSLNLQPFDSNILALSSNSHLKHEQANQLQNSLTDLSSVYEPHLNPAAAHSSENLNLPYNFYLDSFGVLGQSNGNLQWRLPPKLVTMVEEGHSANGRPARLHGMEEPGSENLKFTKGKLLDFMVPRELDEPAASPVWPPPAADGFFDASADTIYWNNVSLPQDMAMYGITGSQFI